MSRISHYRVFPWAKGPLTSLESIAEVPDRHVMGKSSIFWFYFFLLSGVSQASTVVAKVITAFMLGRIHVITRLTRLAIGMQSFHWRWYRNCTYQSRNDTCILYIVPVCLWKLTGMQLVVRCIISDNYCALVKFLSNKYTMKSIPLLYLWHF